MKRIANKIIKGERGQSLILVLILLLLGGLITAPLLSFMSTGLDTGRVYEEDMNEIYAADSGVEDALQQIVTDAPQLPSLTNPLWSYSIADVNGKDVDITIAYINDTTYKITSTATTDADSSTTIESYVSTGGGSPIFDNAITALNGNIILSGNAEVTGDTFANGDIGLSGNARVEGDGTATGDIYLGGNSEIEGDQTEGAAPVVPPQLDTSQYLQEAGQGGTHTGNLSIGGNGSYNLGPLHITGNLSISGNKTVILEGTIYVDGTISMSGNTNIEGGYTIVAGGNAELTGNNKLDLENIPVFISVNGNITVSGNNWRSAVVYAPNGNATLSGNSKVYGSVIGLSVIVGGNSKIEYTVGLGNSSQLPGGGGGSGYQILTWEIS